MYLSNYAYTKQCQKMCALLPALFLSLNVSLSADQASHVGQGTQPIVIQDRDITLEGDLGAFKAAWTFQRPEAHLLLATLTLTAPQPTPPPPLSMKVSYPSVDLAGIWVSDNNKPSNDHQGMNVESRAVLRAPVLTTLGPDDNNRLTVALSDALRPSKIRSSVREEDVRMYVEVKLFADKQMPLTTYQATLRLDTRLQPYYKVLRDTAKWWAAQEGYTPAPVPEAARVPLYSTWYSYHQNVDPATIINECRIGGEIGLEGVIVDDGWQTLDSNRGYAFTGDWKPERIPEMKKFVDGIHALNQKFMLWYSVPMAGEKSEVAKRFKDKTLGFSNSLRAHILDPRYPDVRDYLIGLYENAVREWGIDGLKLDFIELFAPKSDTVLTAEQGRDYASVDEATDRLFTDIMARLRKIKPDIAIEFRQPYNGPLMRKYGNMLRGVDCPNAGPVNRKEIIDLRLLADNTAVHSDMFIWHPEEPVTSAALQLLNVLFSVPQVSVRLGEVSAEHRQMLSFWLKYWKANRATLLDGELRPVSPASNYPLVLARSSDKLIAALYQDMVVSPGSKLPKQLDLVNAKPSRSVVVTFEEAFGPATVRIMDCLGKKISEQSQVLGIGVQAWDVPPSGLLEIRKK
jgi:alpha-galactosidase